MRVFIIKFSFSFDSRISRLKILPKSRVPAVHKPFYPKQHPKNLYSPNTAIIVPEKPVTPLTPYREIPEALYKSREMEEFESPKDAKTLFLGLFGGTNVGKSSLMNLLIGENVSAVSPKAHTTEEKMTGIRTNAEKKVQLVVYDTPGVYHKHGRHHKKYSNQAWKVMEEIDQALFVVDASTKRLDDGIREVLKKLNSKLTDMKAIRLAKDESADFTQMEKLPQEKISKVLVVNKMDLCTNKRDLKWYINELEDLGNFDKIFYISCETGYGIDKLKEYLENEAISDPWVFSPEAKSDLTGVEKIEEIFKSLIFERLHYEIPFQTGIELKEFVVLSNNSAKIEVHLDVQTDIQRRILLGYHGRNIKYIAEKSRIELIKLFKKDFNVSILVKTRTKNLKDYAKMHGVEEIVPKDFPLTKAKEELNKLKKESKANFLEKIKKKIS